MVRRVPKKILIIGNNADFRKELNQKLHKTGYEVFQAFDEESALEVVKDIKMDLVFLAQPGSAESQEEFLLKVRRTFPGKEVRLLLIPPTSDTMSAVLKMDKRVEYLLDWPMRLDDVFLGIDKAMNRGEPKAAKYKVLIAGTEDEAIDDMLQQLGTDYEAQSAVSGSETISKVVQMMPDILIMDVLMDGVPASDIIRILRQMPQFEKKPILTYCYYRISDLGREDVREKVLSIEVAVMQCKNAGNHEYIGRYNETGFLKILNRCLP